jgi:copper chaperone CopZ
MASAFASPEGTIIPTQFGATFEILQYLQSGYEIVHQIRGRIRIRLPQLGRDSVGANQLATRLRAIAGITDVRVNPLSKSVTVLYEENTEAARLIQALPPTAPTGSELDKPLPAPVWEFKPLPWLGQFLNSLKSHLSQVAAIVLQFVGVIFLLVGIVGVILPLLPGTPFLILSALCFFAASELSLISSLAE